MLLLDDSALEQNRDLPDGPERSLGERRMLGAYYTPERLSGILARWAIRAPTETVLEPSFGGCGFLAAALDQLIAQGGIAPASQVFGCDIDPLAFAFLDKLLPDREAAGNFLLQDFLEPVDAGSWPPYFDVILANPPYIPYHRIGKDRVQELAKRSWPVDRIGGKASLWAYFLAHSFRYLKLCGRMAWVLPGAFLQADYARALRQFMAENFERSVAFIVHDRIFKAEGTDEETVVLLAKGFGTKGASSSLEIGEADSLDMLEELITAWECGEWNGKPQHLSAASLSLQDEARTIFDSLSAHPACVRFADFAKVQIGLVTGANDFFVLNDKGLVHANLQPAHCEPILSKFRAAPGLQLLEDDLNRYALQGGRAYLVSSAHPDDHDGVSAYLDTFDAARRETNSTFRKRAVWSLTSDGRRPDAFFPVMHHLGPRLVLNTMTCSCTNTVHRVFFKEKVEEVTAKLLAITMLTSFTQVSAELTGRRYGSGVLKHEPRDAEKILLLMPSVTEAEVVAEFEVLDGISRSGNAAAVMEEADRFVYSRLTDFPAFERESIAQVLTRMRERRRPSRK